MSGQPFAVVKGAGPAGLSSAIVLAQEGYRVLVAEKRPARPEGEGRKNMVAIRPEAIRQLETMGALDIALSSGYLEQLTEAATKNEWDGSVFQWPFLDYPAKDYNIPASVAEQVPRYTVNLGHIEDILARRASAVGVEIQYDATLALKKADGESYQALLVLPGKQPIELGVPDLLVCASGKGDFTLAQQLGFKHLIGVRIDEEHLPVPGSRALQLGPEGEYESQIFSTFGVSQPNKPRGRLDHVVRKQGTGDPLQPLVEMEMNHAKTEHLILQLPRGMNLEDKTRIEEYVVARVNDRLDTRFSSIADIKSAGALVWGSPLRPVTVETATAPQFAFGSNVILVGDAAFSCSPSAGLGAEVSLTLDPPNVRSLAIDLKAAQSDVSVRDTALGKFNLRKAQSAIIWSQGSRIFYIEGAKAKAIASQVEKLQASL